MRTAAQETTFQIALRNCSEEARGELGYIGVLQQRAGSWEHKKITGVFFNVLIFIIYFIFGCVGSSLLHAGFL